MYFHKKIKLLIILSILLINGCKVDEKVEIIEKNYELIDVPDSLYNIQMAHLKYYDIGLYYKFELEMVLSNGPKVYSSFSSFVEKDIFKSYGVNWNYTICSKKIGVGNKNSEGVYNKYGLKCFYLKWEADYEHFKIINDTATIYTNLPKVEVLKLYPYYKGKVIVEKPDSLSIYFENLYSAAEFPKMLEVKTYGNIESNKAELIIKSSLGKNRPNCEIQNIKDLGK